MLKLGLVEIRKTIKGWIPQIRSSQAKKNLQDLEQLKKYHRVDAAKAYALGSDLLKRDSSNEFASYASAWGAWRLKKYEEAIRLIQLAIDINPNNFNYFYIRAESNLRLRNFEQAVKDFQKVILLRPNHSPTWKHLVKLRSDVGMNIILPRNLVVVSFEIGQAYSSRQWTAYETLLEEVKKINPLHGRYWELVRYEFYTKLPDPPRDWEVLHKECLAAGDKALGYSAFCNMFNCLVKEGDHQQAFPQLPKFQALYTKACPVVYAPGVCALMMREHQFQQCLSFLDESIQNQNDEESKQTYELKTYQYRMMCEQALNMVQKPSDAFQTSNPLSDGLMEKMLESHHEKSSAGIIVNACAECWQSIRNSTKNLLLDLRYNNQQVTALQSKISSAVENKTGLSLLRLGDSDSYGFANHFPNHYSVELAKNTENMWWGKHIDAPLKQKLVNGFFNAIESADIIGFPGSIRLARDLKVDPSAKLSVLQMKYQTLFQGIKNFLDEGRIQQDKWWVDEYCNFSLADEGFLTKLIEKAPSVVLVTCFKIPSNHFLDHPKVKQVSIPPHTRVSAVCEAQNNTAIFPELLDEKKKEVLQHLSPGSLLLVSAGFAGKSLIDLGKKAGAVAIDFGSAMDGLVGHKTRSSELYNSIF